MNEPSLQSVLPVAARDAVANGMNEDFRSSLKLPKKMNRYLVARAMDRVLLEHLTVAEVKAQMGLVKSEAEYVEKVVAEFRAWEAANKAPAEPEKE